MSSIIKNFANLPIVLIYLVGGLGAFLFRQGSLIWDKNIQSFFEIITCVVLGIGGAGYCFFRERKYFGFIIFLLMFFFFFLFLPFYCSPDSSVRVFLIESKAFIYLLTALFWCGGIGQPSKTAIYQCAKLFACLYMLNQLLMIIRLGFYTRFFHFISECNYDVFLILLGFIFWSDYGKKWKDFFIFAMAVCLSGSLTGVITIIVMTFMCHMPKNKVYFFFLLAVACMGAYACFLLKYDDDFIQNPYSIDRFVFFAQAYESFKTLPWWQKLLGSTLGCSLPEETILPDFYSYVFRFEEMNNIHGLYPFAFHATYLRLLFLLGLPLTICVFFYLIFRFFREKRSDAKLFIVVFMLFSTSLSTMTITNGGLMLFLLGIVVLFPEHSLAPLTCTKAKG